MYVEKQLKATMREMQHSHYFMHFYISWVQKASTSVCIPAHFSQVSFNRNTIFFSEQQNHSKHLKHNPGIKYRAGSEHSWLQSQPAYPPSLKRINTSYYTLLFHHRYHTAAVSLQFNLTLTAKSSQNARSRMPFLYYSFYFISYKAVYS